MITVFTSCYNQGRYLERAIASVLSQTHRDFEYILIDDGSTDHTWSIIQDYAKIDWRIRPVRVDKQLNVGFVINRSIRMMEGSYWVWCPADDIFKKDLLEEKLKKSFECYHKAVIYSWWEQIDENSNFIMQHTPNLSLEEFSKVIWDECPLGCTGVWIPKDVFTIVGKFPENLPCSEDYAWVLRAVSEKVPFICVNKILYSKRIHANRTTNRKSNLVPNVVSKIRKEYAAKFR